MKRVFVFTLMILLGGCGGEEKKNNPSPNKNIVGMWQYAFKDAIVNSSYISLGYLIFFENNEVLTFLPNGGYRIFNKEASKADSRDKDYWATYTFQDNVCMITYKDGITRKLTYLDEYTLKTEGALDMSDARKLPNVDGMTLHGFWSWSSYRTVSSIFSTYKQENQRPLIKFNRDGTFEDFGEFEFGNFTLSSRLKDKAKAGKGRYEIKYYTLILDYDRSENNHFEITFTVSPNEKNERPGEDSSAIYLNGSVLQRVQEI